MKRDKILAALLIVSLLLSASCGGKSESHEMTTAATAEESTIELSGRKGAPDSLPPDLNFNGQTVTLISRQDVELFKWEFYSEEQTGDILNDAIYERNRAVEDRLNINLEVMLAEGTWGKWDTFFGLIKGSALAGDGSIDIVPFYAFEQAGLASQGLYMNLLDLNYLDLDKPWWNQNLIKNATINGSLYMATGDIAVSSIAMMAAIAFNRNLKDKYLPEADLYQDVRDGKWTFDRLFDYSKDVYTDLNGNATVDDGDIFGFDGGRADQFIHSAKVKYSEIGADGIPVLSMNNERMIRLVDKVQSFYSQPGYAPDAIKNVTGTMFPDGKLLFSNRYVRDIASLRDMKDDYGVLPMPKLDEEQDGYYTTLGDSYSQVAVVVGTKSPDAAAATMECLAAESYRNVTEIYFENVLKVKYAHDEETAEMLDILLAGIDIDFVEIYGRLVGTPISKIRLCLQEACSPFVSTYTQIEGSVNEKIKDLFKTSES